MDKNTFGQLVMDNERQLYRIAKSILKNDEDCADAAQEAVKKAFEKLDTLREDRYAKTWLIKILIRVCYDLLAEQKKETRLEENCKWNQKEKDNYEDLYEALFTLEKEFRVVLVLHYLEGYQMAETSELLGIPEGTVKSRLYRGRKKLQELLSKETGNMKSGKNGKRVIRTEQKKERRES